MLRWYVLLCSRQDSYDESLNPFGGEEKARTEGEKDNANTNAENKSIDDK